MGLAFPVATEACFASRSWTGVETSFAGGFSAQETSDVVVYSRSGSTDTLLTEGVHYSVTLGPSDGAVTVVPIALPTAPRTILILRNTPATQPVAFADLGLFTANTHTELHSKAALRDAEDKFHRARMLGLPLGDTSPTLPSLATLEGGVLGVVGGQWVALGVSLGLGTVVGPTSSTDNALARWNGTSGAVLQNGAATLSDGGALAGISKLDIVQSPPFTLERALSITQALGGAGAGPQYVNWLQISQDSAKVTGAGGIVIGFLISHLFGGGDKGARQAFGVEARRTSAQDPATTIEQDVGASWGFNGHGNNNGTSGAKRGYGYGSFSVAALQDSATYWKVLAGHEMDIVVDSGSSVESLIGYQITQLASHANNGIAFSSALSFTNNPGAVGWPNLVSLNNTSGAYPMNAAGTVLATIGAQSFAHGIDFSSATISGNFLKGPNGFSATGAGAVIAGTSVTAGTSISATTSVSSGTFHDAAAASGYRLGGNAVLLASGDYTQLSDSAGVGSIQVGNAVGNATFYNNTSHVFRSRAAGAYATINGAGIALNGGTSGIMTLSPPAVAGSSQIIFPAGSTDFQATGGAGRALKQTSVGGAITVAQIAASELSGLGTNVGAWLATPSSANLAAALTDETGSGAAVFATSPTLVTPALGTPASGTLTNCTGLPVGGITGLGSGIATWLATPSSANLAAALTDEVGSGAAVFATSPRFTTDASPASSGGATLGTAALPWGNHFAASGSKIDWGNGNMTLTHASGSPSTLSFAGGVMKMTFPNDNALQILSGASGSFAGFNIGRTGSEGGFFVPSAGNQVLTGAATGDFIAYATGGSLLLGSSSAAQIGIAITTLGKVQMPLSLNVGDTTDPGSNNLNVKGVTKTNGTQVVSSRKTGWATATGTATRTTYDTTTVTLSQLAERVKALIDDLHGTAGHGLIGT